MSSHDTCAVVITYHPEPSVFERLTLFRSQANGLVVVDNGSKPAVIESLRRESERVGFRLIENGENLGIAAALNTGIRWAIDNNFEWVVLFDQDSAIPEGYIDALLASVVSETDQERIAIVAPQYRDPVQDGLYRSRFSAQDGTPLEIMTTGSLLPTWIFEKCGWFEEALFIDQVDHEFCFRVRERGYRLLVCENMTIDHLPGSPRGLKLLGIKWISLNDYSPERRYYQTRNGLIMARRYKDRYPLWSRKTRNDILWKNPLKILLAESRRWEKLVNVARGVIDAFLGRMGKRVDL
jgi:rhamnosyltransferase